MSRKYDVRIWSPREKTYNLMLAIDNVQFFAKNTDFNSDNHADADNRTTLWINPANIVAVEVTGREVPDE